MIIRNLAELEMSFKTLFRTAKIIIETGRIVEADVNEFKPKRTNGQNAYYWLSCGWVSDCLNDAGLTYGEYKLPYNKNIVHDIQKHLFGVETTTKMKKDEFCEYIDKVTCLWQDKTKGAYQPKELPLSYLERKGYDLDYIYRN